MLDRTTVDSSFVSSQLPSYKSFTLTK